jgi:hypothetical protein
VTWWGEVGVRHRHDAGTGEVGGGRHVAASQTEDKGGEKRR